MKSLPTFQTTAVLLAGFLALTACRQGEQATEAKPKGLTLDVSVEQVPPFRLKMRLANQGSITEQVEYGYLPWAHYASTIILVPADDIYARPLATGYPYSDPIPGMAPTDLRPGAVLEGEVLLEHRFRDLPGALTRDDVLVFWSYQPHMPGGVRGERFGGMVLIHRLGNR